MTLRARRLLDLVGELDVRAARREAHRLQVEHAAAAEPALHRVGRETEVLLPVGDQDHPGEMAARGVAGTHLLGHRHEAAVGLDHVDEVGNHVVGPGVDEQLGRVRRVLGEPPVDGLGDLSILPIAGKVVNFAEHGGPSFIRRAAAPLRAPAQVQDWIVRVTRVAQW